MDFLTTPEGAKMPINKIKPADLARHNLVNNIVGETKAAQELLKKHKEDTLLKIYEFLDEVAKQYGTTYGGTKGNVTLTSYDQKMKVVISKNEQIAFTEQLAIAEKLVGECLEDWSDGANENLVAFVKTAFHRTKEGGVSVGKMLGLLRLEIKEDKWQRAMLALKDSMVNSGSKSYLRVYERVDAENAWIAIPLDVAKV